MKWFSNFSLVCQEIRVGYKLLLLGILITSTMIGVSVVFYNLNDYIFPAINGQYDDKFDDGLKVNIHNLNLDDVNILKENGAEDISITINMSQTLSKSVIKSKSSSSNYEGAVISGEWYNKTSVELEYFPDDFSYDDFNMSNDAIVFCSNSNGYNIGDEIELHLDSGELVNKFTVLSVITDSDIVQEEELRVVLPLYATVKSMEDYGIFIDYSVECKLPKPSMYSDFKNTLNKDNILCSSNFDDVIAVIDMLSMLCLIMSIVFIVITIFAITNIFTLHIDTRERFIILQKVLGNTAIKITLTYLVILELQIVISNILGCILSSVFTEHILQTAYSAFSFSIEFNMNYWLVLLGTFAVSNISLIPFAIVMMKKINQKDVISIINNKD